MRQILKFSINSNFLNADSQTKYFRVSCSKDVSSDSALLTFLWEYHTAFLMPAAENRFLYFHFTDAASKKIYSWVYSSDYVSFGFTLSLSSELSITHVSSLPSNIHQRSNETFTFEVSPWCKAFWQEGRAVIIHFALELFSQKNKYKHSTCYSSKRVNSITSWLHRTTLHCLLLSLVKSHTIGETLLHLVIEEVLSTVMHDPITLWKTSYLVIDASIK